MTNIPNENFNLFLTQKLDLSSSVFTDKLESINRYNIFARLANSSQLDSRNICKNIEATITPKLQSLSDVQKKMALDNLSAMKTKFSKASEHIKASDCKQTIDRITALINASQAPSQPARAPNATTQVPAPRPEKKNSTLTNDSAKTSPRQTSPRQTTEKSIAPISTVNTISTAPATTKAVLKAQAQHTNGANAALVAAISRSNEKTELTTTTSVQFSPNMKRIAEVEKGVTDRDRVGFKRSLLYFPYEDKYYFNALVVKGEGFNRVIRHTRVEATEIKQQVQTIKKSGCNDIGALLRDQMSKMGIGYEVK